MPRWCTKFASRGSVPNATPIVYKVLVFEAEQSTPYQVRLKAGGKTATIRGEPIADWDGDWQFDVYASDVGRWDDGSLMTAEERAAALQLLRDCGTHLS